MNILYLSYTGLLEPLGRSQVLAYLARLSCNHAITLVTVEKSEDLSNRTAVSQMEDECRARAIRWYALTYHQRPRVPATVWDLISLFALAARSIRRDSIDLIHCRGYIPAIVALLLRATTGRPFVFDMRALWIDEMIAARRLPPRGPLTAVLRRVEARLLLAAAVVVSLTQAAVDYLSAQKQYRHVRFRVIPTCVDIERFSGVRRTDLSRGISVGSVGTIASGWFLLDWLAEFFKVLSDTSPTATLRVVTRDDPQTLVEVLRNRGVDLARVSFTARAPEDVPFEMATLDVGAMFFTSGIAKLGSAPTRMGEFLAAGLPCVVNSGVGDAATLVRKYAVGVVVDDWTIDSMRRGVAELLELLNDPDVGERCRQAAREYFSVERGVEAYDRIYREIGVRGPAV